MFQSAPPVRGATVAQPSVSWRRPMFQSAPPARGATIGIARGRVALPSSSFNPRPPCGGRRDAIGVRLLARCSFNPRPPCGGRPHAGVASACVDACFNPRPPCGGRRAVTAAALDSRGFNPRPPCGGRPAPHGAVSELFQSAPPVRGATDDVDRGAGGVSIRAPRAGGDPQRSSALARLDASFNPRPPCGGRPSDRLIAPAAREFQSAPPVRGATCDESSMARRTAVSIRAPRAGGDRCALADTGRRRRVSIRAPRAGGDAVSVTAIAAAATFQSAPPVRGATPAIWSKPDMTSFNPRPPCGGRRTYRGLTTVRH